jgi:hypothetical protein
VYERLKAKTGGYKSLAHNRWSGGRGDLSRGKWIGDERFGSGRGHDECAEVDRRREVWEWEG